jgi:WD40 repeat protein
MASQTERIDRVGNRHRLLAATFLLLISTPSVFPQKPEIVVQMGPDSVWSGAFSPDGKTLVSTGTASRVISILQIESGRELRSLVGHTQDVNYVTYSPDRKTLASGGDDKTDRICRARCSGRGSFTDGSQRRSP